MNIIFDCIGLEFHAEVTYSPGEAPDWEDWGYPSECEIKSLSVNGIDFMALIQSDIGDQIQDAAHEAADAEWPIHVLENEYD